MLCDRFTFRTELSDLPECPYYVAHPQARFGLKNIGSPIFDAVVKDRIASKAWHIIWSNKVKDDVIDQLEVESQ